MNGQESIEQELAKAAVGLKEGNEGLARVCARRAVGIAIEDWIARSGAEGWPADAMNRLKAIQREENLPQKVREAAQRLLTPVTQQTRLPLSTDPIGDARLILVHFTQRN